MLARAPTVTAAVATTMRVVFSVAPTNCPTASTTHPAASATPHSAAKELLTKTGPPRGADATGDKTALLAAADCVRAALRDRRPVAAELRDVGGAPSPLLPSVAARPEGGGSRSRGAVPAAVAVLLEKDATFGPHLLASLSGDSLRLLLVVATAQEYFGQDAVEAQLRAVDKDQDDNISSQDYNAWMETAVRERAAMRFVMPCTAAKAHDTTTNNTTTTTTTTTSTATSSTTATTNTTATTTTTATNTTTTSTRDLGYISWDLWYRLALSAALPFMAFGVLDNAIFVTVGDVIDKTFAETFNLSTMAAAALGGVASGTIGIQIHGLAVRITQKSRLAQAPKLTSAQYASASCGSATRVGSTLGMMAGLFLGMAPLLLLSPSVSWSERERLGKE